MQDYDSRLRRLEDRDRFDCDQEERKHHQQQRKEHQERGEGDLRERSGESHYVNLNKRLKAVEERISKLKESPNAKLSSLGEAEVGKIVEEHTQHRIKKLEKRMKKYFANKFEDIELLLKKSKKHKSKSPSARTPLEMSTMSRYEIEHSSKPLSQFLLEDSSVCKNEPSTMLRESKATTISNRNKNAQELKEKKKIKKVMEE
jgi:hypothetical protein